MIRLWFLHMRQHKIPGSAYVLLLVVFCIVSFTILYIVTKYSTKLPMNTPKGSVKRIVKSVMSPFDSHPPKSIPLNVTNDLRHACLQEIRNHRHSFYLPYIQQAHHILLVDPAYHSNVGDHMITIAELELLKYVSTTKATTSIGIVSQCSYVQAHTFVPSCDDILPLELPNYSSLHSSKADASEVSSTTGSTIDPSSQYKVALWHGGGNFGNLWSTAQQSRIHSIVLLLQANYTIIGMPNSWYYTNSQLELNDMQKLRSNIIRGLRLDVTTSTIDETISDLQLASHAKARIIWTWREHYSYERAVQLLPYCTHQLVPDIAFQLGPYEPHRPISIPSEIVTSPVSNTIPSIDDFDHIFDIVFLLRNDHESVYSTVRNRQSIQNLLNSIPGAEQLSFSIVDWDDRLVRFQSNNMNDIYFTETSIQLLSMGRILICDRLHSAILAYISHLSFIYLDQVSGKIFKTFTVAMESGPHCKRSNEIYNEILQIENTTKGIPMDFDPNTLWSHAETLSDAMKYAVHFLHLQKRVKPSSQTAGQNEQRR